MKRLELLPIKMEPNKKNHCLIGKIILQKHLNQYIVKDITQAEWKCKRDFRVSSISHNIFFFTFQEKEDLAKVLQNGPWTIMGGLLILTFCSSTKVLLPHELQFTYSGFWVQAHGLPLNYLTPENGFKIGSFLGVFVCNDKNSLENENGMNIRKKFIRLRVILDIRKPLVSGFWLKQGIWVDFKYEKLGVFCYKCGRIGQNYRTCMFPPPAGNESFGPWLRAWPVNDDSKTGLKVVGIRDEQNDSTVLVPVLKAKATLIQSSDAVDIHEEMEPDEAEEAALGIPMRKLCKRFVWNMIDTMCMLMNCGVIFSRVTSADGNGIELGNWGLFAMAAYLLHLFLKFIRVIRGSIFLNLVPDDGNPLRDIFILILFLVTFLYF
ncbi:hypothetical protein ACJIZ3_016846 [Penstemon smallii]|uniref:CCHC-type domain-containing protein n=1 Tax=Penstemon smallii TaxID=265156 RepID=A0ABD3STW1_9LAMI